MQYEILKSMDADTPDGSHKPFRAGQIITENDMLAGCLDAGLKRHTIKAIEPAKEETASPAATPMPPVPHAPHTQPGPHKRK